MNDQAKALLFVAALFGGVGFTGGRATAPVPPPEIRLVRLPARIIPIAPAPESAPAAPAVVEPAAPVEPPPPQPPVAEAKPPLPAPRPKPVEAKPKERAVEKPRPRPAPVKKATLPSCAAVKREYERMSWTEKMAAYHKASAEQIAHGRRCLGL